MPPTITPIYAIALTVLLIVLSVRVLRYRRANRVALGDAGDAGLLSRIRAQGNLTEYAPIALMLLLLAEMQGTPALWLHLCGITLLTGRVLHGVGLSWFPRRFVLRVAGMVLTFLALGLGAILALPV